MRLPDVEVHPMLDARLSGGPTRWLGVSTTVPTVLADGTGYGNVTEPVAASYARVQVAASDWPAAANRLAQVDVVWPDTVDDLGIALAWVMFPTATGGVPTLAGELDDPLPLPAGTTNITIACPVGA